MSDFDSERVLRLISGGFLYLQCNPLEVRYISGGITSKSIVINDETRIAIEQFFIGSEHENQKLFQTWIKVACRLVKVQSWRKVCVINPVKEVMVDSGNGVELFNVEYHPDIIDRKTLAGVVIQLSKTDKNAPVVTDSMRVSMERENEVTTTLSIANTPFEEIKAFICDTADRLKNCIKSAEELYDLYDTARKDFQAGKIVPDEVTKRLESIYVDTLFRHFHTIKGNAVTYEFNNLTECAHEAETISSQLKQPGNIRRTDIVKSLKEAIARISSAFEFVITIFEKIHFSNDDEQMMRVPFKKVNDIYQLCELIDLKASPEEVKSLVSECRTLSWKTLGSVTRKYTRVVYSRSVKLGKHIEFTVDNPSELVEPGIFEKLDDSLVQIISNAVVHGIEENDVRYLNKKGSGHIWLSYQRGEKEVVVKIEDDGQGIRTDLIVQQCLQQNQLTSVNAETMTEEDKVKLIFLPHASTASSVTMYAGRGVGLDVVNNRIRSMGGTVTVTTVAGKGTCFTIVIPILPKE
ncbi:MAG TPA: ATP-binding protein [Chitinispirillaceae bacterium]|nr:ATP-binding protein [Chitinispirillaceae bacterium]